MTAWRGLALALSWLTVLPVRTGTGSAPAAGVAAAAIRWAPVVGALVGAVSGALAWGLVAAGVPTLVAGLLGVAAGVLATRGMHVDVLADTVVGSRGYGPPE
ncbi:adenosylcobinamide-GDP ribazoletransferase, partial [Pseudonocardia benzenivorans]